MKTNNEMLRLNNIKYDDCKVAFFTGYPNYGVLKALSILGPDYSLVPPRCFTKE